MKPNTIQIKPKHPKLYKWQQDAMRKIAKAQIISCCCSRQVGKTQLASELLVDYLFNYNKTKYPRALVAGKTSESVYNTFFLRVYQQLQSLPDTVLTKRGS